MVVDLEIDASSRVVTLAISGPLSDEGLMTLAAQLRTAPGVEPDFGLLIDLRHAVASGELSSEGVRGLARLPLVFGPDSRRAVVAGSDSCFGLARMYQMLRTQGLRRDIRVSRDLEEARRWVNHSVYTPHPDEDSSGEPSKQA